ncbi:hypothetical protein B0A52_01244 [Exophiala mesophila]|uniref:NmrA-like domain-containing protein n=1 Tax=Exophiala mesophila TaxID=212818 RepID=A0A438NGX0_EXOME|nr:hypothetical protein B0A52_01244 [Exophiala mesophila]
MSTFLVTGATGQQGGAVVDELLAAGAKVHATVRDLSAPKAKALASRGVVLFQGTHEEPEEVFKAAAKGCVGLFLNVSTFDPATAKKHAADIIKACKAGAGSTLTSIVLSSTLQVDELIAHADALVEIHPWIAQYYAAKAGVEAAVRESGIANYTILRPPVLHHDYVLPAAASSHAYYELVKSATLVTSIEDDKTLPYLDAGDVGKFAAAALLKPSEFSGHEIALGSENLTARDIAEIISRVSGIPIKLHRRTPEEKEASKNTEFFQGFEGIANRFPRKVDVSALEKKYGIKMTTFEEYMEKNKELLLDSLPPRSSAFLEKMA